MKNVNLMTLKKPLMGGKPSYVSFGANLGRTTFYEAFFTLWYMENHKRSKERVMGHAAVKC
ncbi:hypothetical protein PIB30_076924, partial [Stylosanthes scabra]|nr:hypothetical protein [Stylosanthes scabra]